MKETSGVWRRLSHPEDGLTERKPEGAGERDFKETIVSFANSVPQGYEGVLFIGIADKTGEILGCNGVDSLQKTLSRICENECYPPIEIRLESQPIDGKIVLAVIVPYSQKRPHFSGHAFRRVGSQNKKSDEAAYLDFITARNSVGAKILENRGKMVMVRTLGKKLGDPRPLPPNTSDHGQFLIEACDSHTVTLQSAAADRRYVEQLENFSISQDPSGRLLLLVQNTHR